MSLEQIKKQSKRLHKIFPEVLAEKKEINLALAQEVVARQFGYPSFHAAASRVDNPGCGPTVAPQSVAVLAPAVEVSPFGSSWDLARLDSVCRRPIKLASSFPMLEAGDLGPHDGDPWFTETAKDRSFDVYLVWVGCSGGVDEYCVFIHSLCDGDRFFFDAGAFLNRDDFRRQFVGRVLAVVGRNPRTRTLKVVSACVAYPGAPYRPSSSLHFFSVDHVECFEKAFHWEPGDCSNKWLIEGTEILTKLEAFDSLLPFNAQHVLVCAHTYLLAVSSDPKRERPSYDEVYGSPLLDPVRLLGALRAFSAVGADKGDLLDLGVRWVLPDPLESPARRLVESYLPFMTGLANSENPPISRALGAPAAMATHFHGFDAGRRLSGVSRLLSGLKTKPIDFGTEPFLVCSALHLSRLSPLLARSAAICLAQGFHVVYISRNGDTLFSSDLSSQVEVVNLRLLELSAKEVSSRFEEAVKSTHARENLCVFVEDADILAKEPSFMDFVARLAYRRCPTFLMTNAPQPEDNEILFSSLHGIAFETVFSMDEGASRAKWFNKHVLKASFIDSTFFRAQYHPADFLVHSRVSAPGTHWCWHEVLSGN